jgi:hypothetical protein
MSIYGLGGNRVREVAFAVLGAYKKKGDMAFRTMLSGLLGVSKPGPSVFAAANLRGADTSTLSAGLSIKESCINWRRLRLHNGRFSRVRPVSSRPKRYNINITGYCDME